MGASVVGSALLLLGCDAEPRATEEPQTGIEIPTARVDEPAPEQPAGEQEEEDAAACSPAEALFPYAVCVCEDLDDAGVLHVYGDEAWIGVNGYTVLEGAPRIAGSAVFYAGLETESALEVRGDLSSGGDVETRGVSVVEGTLDVGGDMIVEGVLSVGEMLRVRGEEKTHQGLVEAGSRGDYVAPPQPCGCAPEDLLDVAGRVREAEQDNHNASIGLTGDNPGRLELPTGRYYVKAEALSNTTQLVVAGHVALFVEGSLDVVGVQSIEIAETGTLDLYVSGGVRSVGVLTAGSAARPGAFRMYLGGDDAVSLSTGAQAFYGSIYAPRAEVHHAGTTRIVGSIFARRISTDGVLEVEYGEPLEIPDDACPDRCLADPDAGGCGYPPDYVPEG